MNLNFTLVAQAIVFAAFIWFTVKFVWPHMLRAIETRQKTIADGLAAAEQGKRSLETSTKQADEAIKDSGIDLSTEEERVMAGVMIGSGIGGLPGITDGALTLHERGPRRLTPFFIPAMSIINGSPTPSTAHSQKTSK